MLRHVDLCSGIGGFALGFQWAELSKTIMFCDTEKWCREILAKNFPNVPITNDVKELANDPERLVPDHDILSAGYPCQPFSVAGRQKGEKDDRHIWPYIFRIITCKRPTWCVFENVYGHIALGLDKVLADLESEGYSTRTFIVPACAKDAPHRRDRLWIIAHSDSKSEPDVSEHEGKRQGKLGERTTIVGNSEHDGSLATEIGRSNEENARGSEEGSETTEQSSRASGSGHDETLSRPNDVADTTFLGLQEHGYSKSAKFVEGSQDVADSESERHRRSSSEERGDEQRIVFTSEQEGSSVGSETEGRSSSHGEDVADSDSDDERSREKPRQSEGDTSRERIGDGSFDVADSDDEGSQGGIHRGENSERQSFDGHSGRSRSTHRQSKQEFWTVEPNVGRVAHGIPRRVDRLKGLGNAIVPQISMQIGLAIKKEIER